LINASASFSLKLGLGTGIVSGVATTPPPP
jgi:hypothetical protein